MTYEPLTSDQSGRAMGDRKIGRRGRRGRVGDAEEWKTWERRKIGKRGKVEKRETSAQLTGRRGLKRRQGLARRLQFGEPVVGETVNQ
mgnify:CR=1 FL=1